MPVYLRRFYVTKLTEYVKKESEQIEKTQNKKYNVSRPDIR